MKYQFNRSIVIGVILLSVCFLVAEQFVLKRDHKRKKVSTNTLREQCATCMGQMLELLDLTLQLALVHGENPSGPVQK